MPYEEFNIFNILIIVCYSGKGPVSIEVPEYVIEGQTVHMYCSFNYKSFYSLKVSLLLCLEAKLLLFISFEFGQNYWIKSNKQ